MEVSCSVQISVGHVYRETHSMNLCSFDEAWEESWWLVWHSAVCVSGVPMAPSTIRLDASFAVLARRVASIPGCWEYPLSFCYWQQ